MAKVKKKSKIKTGRDGLDLSARPSNATTSNLYHANMADKYFEEAKNSPGSGAWSAVKGAYHWLRSKPALFGESGKVTGIAPADFVPGTSLWSGLKNAEKAKILFLRLSPAEQKNVSTMLKNVGRTLDDVTDRDVWEIQRLVNGKFKSSSVDLSDYGIFDIGARIKDGSRWAGGTSTPDW